MKKRIIALLMMTVMMCMSVVGCSSQSTQKEENETKKEENTSETGGVVKLKIWAEEANWEVTNKMIDSFKAKYKNEATFEIELIQGNDGETKNNLLADVYGGADVFSFADDQLNAMVSGGALAAVPNPDEIKAANLEDAVNSCMVNGVMYAYPMTADNGYFLYYNKEFLSEEDVKTFDGLLAAAEAAGKKVTMDWTSGWYLYSFFGNTGLDFGLNEDGVTNHCNWNTTEGNIKGVDIAQALLNISSSSAFMNAGDAALLEGAADGTVIAGISGVWNEVEIKKAWGENYGAVKLPTYTVAGQQVQMASFKGYKMMGVNYYSENKEWALKLADWLTNEENQTLRFVERSQGPSNKKAAASDAVSKVPAIQAVIAQSEFGVLQRVGNSYWAPLTEFGEAMASGNSKGTDLQEIMDVMVEGITASVGQ